MTEITNAPPPLKPRRWPVALLVAFITACAGAALAAPISDWAMEAHHVSTMEGGRACAVIAIWMPLAFIVGFAIGFTIGMVSKRPGFAGFLLKQGISLAAVAALVLTVGGLSYAAADHPPLIDRRALALEMQVRVPAKGRSVAELQAQELDVALVVSASDRSYSDLRWAEATQSDEFIIVPAWARLKSRNANREITAGVKDENRQIFNVLRRASPKEIDEAWSEWTPPKQRFDGTKPSLEDQYLVRYRVRFAAEYSPTPTPTATPDERPGEPAEEEPAEPAASP
jgi:hypothetical protein